jgi:hypothetical protein
MFGVSSLHRLTFLYDHCRFDMEDRLRFYRPRDLDKLGAHGFQFQVWRYSGETRHLVYSIALFIFYAIIHVLITQHMSNALHWLSLGHINDYWKQMTEAPDLSEEQIQLR